MQSCFRFFILLPGGWNITAEEFNAFLKEVEMEEYDIQIIYNPRQKWYVISVFSYSVSSALFYMFISFAFT